MREPIAEAAEACNKAELAFAFHCAELTISDVQAVRRAGDRDAAVFVHAGQIMQRMPTLRHDGLTIKHLDMLYFLASKFQPHSEENLDTWIERTTSAYMFHFPQATKKELHDYLVRKLEEELSTVFRTAEQADKEMTAASRKGSRWSVKMGDIESERLWEHVTKDAKQRATTTGEELDEARAKVIVDRLNGGKANSVVHVHVFRTLGGGGWIPGVGTISAVEADKMEMHADTVDYPTRPADVDGYRPSEEQRVWVMARDQSCRFPGCDHPVHHCDLDHIEEYNHDNPDQGGSTSVDNLQALCRYHRNLKTNKIWRAHRVVWTGPGYSFHTEVEDPT